MGYKIIILKMGNLNEDKINTIKNNIEVISDDRQIRIDKEISGCKGDEKLYNVIFTLFSKNITNITHVLQNIANNFKCFIIVEEGILEFNNGIKDWLWTDYIVKPSNIKLYIEDPSHTGSKLGTLNDIQRKISIYDKCKINYFKKLTSIEIEISDKDNELIKELTTICIENGLDIKIKNIV